VIAPVVKKDFFPAFAYGWICYWISQNRCLANTATRQQRQSQRRIPYTANVRFSFWPSHR
jgi:hypothetical protein